MSTKQYWISWVAALGLMLMTVFPSRGWSAGQNASSNPEYPVHNISGFFKNTLEYDDFGDNPLGFDIWLARVGVNAQLTDRISANVTGGWVEPPDNNPQLVNAFIDFRVNEQFRLRAGQFLVPFGLEGQEPIFLNPLINRSLTVRTTNPLRMFRDLGVQASGDLGMINYSAAIVNGTGANIAEQIDPKDLIGRIGLSLSQELELGTSFHIGRYQPVGNDDDFQRVRIGADASYEQGPYVIRAEYIYREDDQPDGSLSQQGGYLLGGYHLTDDWQIVSRFETLDPNTDADNSEIIAWSAAVNYYFARQTRFTLNYEYRDDQGLGDSGSILTAEIQVQL